MGLGASGRGESWYYGAKFGLRLPHSSVIYNEYKKQCKNISVAHNFLLTFLCLPKKLKCVLVKQYLFVLSMLSPVILLFLS